MSADCQMCNVSVAVGTGVGVAVGVRVGGRGVRVRVRVLVAVGRRVRVLDTGCCGGAFTCAGAITGPEPELVDTTVRPCERKPPVLH